MYVYVYVLYVSLVYNFSALYIYSALSLSYHNVMTCMLEEASCLSHLIYCNRICLKSNRWFISQIHAKACQNWENVCFRVDRHRITGIQETYVWNTTSIIQLDERSHLIPRARVRFPTRSCEMSSPYMQLHALLYLLSPQQVLYNVFHHLNPVFHFDTFSMIIRVTRFIIRCAYTMIFIRYSMTFFIYW